MTTTTGKQIIFTQFPLNSNGMRCLLDTGLDRILKRDDNCDRWSLLYKGDGVVNDRFPFNSGAL